MENTKSLENKSATIRNRTNSRSTTKKANATSKRSLTRSEKVAIIVFFMAAFLAAFLGFILLSQQEKNKPNTQPVIESFTATPTALVTKTPQNFSVLKWKTKLANVVTLTASTDASNPLTVTGKESYVVRPLQTTVYTLSATNSESGNTQVALLTLNVVSGPIPVINSFGTTGPDFYASVGSVNQKGGIPLSWNLQYTTDGFVYSSQSVNGVNSFPLSDLTPSPSGESQVGSMAIDPAQLSGVSSQNFLFELNVHNSVSDYWVGSVAFPSIQVGGTPPGFMYANQILSDSDGKPGVAYTTATMPISNSTLIFERIIGAGLSQAADVTARLDYGCNCRSLQSNVDSQGNFSYTSSFPLYFTYPTNVSLVGTAQGANEAVVAKYNQQIQFLSYVVVLGDLGNPLYVSTGWNPPPKELKVPKTCLQILADIASGLAYIVFQISGAPDTVTLSMNVVSCALCGTGNCPSQTITDNEDTPCSSNCTYVNSSCSANCQQAVNGYKVRMPLSFSFKTIETACLGQPLTLSFCVTASLSLGNIPGNFISATENDFFSFTLTSSDPS